jgi:hypothetical protein
MQSEERSAAMLLLVLCWHAAHRRTIRGPAPSAGKELYRIRLSLPAAQLLPTILRVLSLSVVIWSWLSYKRDVLS